MMKKKRKSERNDDDGQKRGLYILYEILQERKEMRKSEKSGGGILCVI